jgi:hypothetical protein
MALAILSAASLPLLKAKIEGPEPDIPEPKAPFSIAVLIRSKPGIVQSATALRFHHEGNVLLSRNLGYIILLLVRPHFPLHNCAFETVCFNTERASDVLVQSVDERPWHIILKDFLFYNI